MSETRHTPGPWKHRQGMILGRSKGGCEMKKSDFMVAQIRGWGHLQYLGEKTGAAIQEANARLIAAAPETKQQRDDLLTTIKNALVSLAIISIPTMDNLADVATNEDLLKIMASSFREAIASAEKGENEK